MLWLRAEKRKVLTREPSVHLAQIRYEIVIDELGGIDHRIDVGALKGVGRINSPDR